MRVIFFHHADSDVSISRFTEKTTIISWLNVGNDRRTRVGGTSVAVGGYYSGRDVRGRGRDCHNLVRSILMIA